MSSAGNTCAFKISADQLVRDESFVDEFVCKICQVHVVGCAPQLTKCSHLFCGDCLQQWFTAHPNNQTWAQRAKMDGAVPCPVCKTMLRKEDDLYPVEEHGTANSQLLWRMIQGLPIKCDAKHSDCIGSCCTWKGTYGSYLEHLQSGTCGTLQPEVTDTQQKEENSIVCDEFTKQCPVSPSASTCSEIVTMHALEELSTDFSSEECSVRDESEGDDFPFPTCDPSCKGAEPIASVQSVVPTMVPNASSSNKAAKSNKGKKKKQQQKSNESAVQYNGRDTCTQLTPTQWQQAYQWQYQMARAQHYQMAVQTLRMQQYYQQLHMSAVRC